MGSILLYVTALALVATGAAAQIDANSEVIAVASDPAKGAPIIEPVYGGWRSDKEEPMLGGPGLYWPERARRLDKAGVVVLSCSVRADRWLTDCAVVAEGPLRYGFGDAALQMARDGWVRASESASVASWQRARIVVRFLQADVERYNAAHPYKYMAY